MLKLTKVSTLALVLMAGAAAAQEADPNIDVNGDGFYSFPEVSTIYPDLTDADFTTMDSTGDGLLDMAEVAAAQDAGLMPVAE
jgi:opacity protein-like surface antigen